MKAVLRLASLTSSPSLWLVTPPPPPPRCRPDKTKCENISNRGICNIRHCYICVTRGYESIHTKKSQYSPNTVPTKLGYKGFEITDYFILVNDPEVTESFNNGQLFPFLMHSYDYLKIVNDGRMVGKYCGIRTGQNILLTGHQILITLHSDGGVQRTGFLIHFTAGPHGKCFS